MKNTGLSVVLATYNEDQNLGECLDSVKDLAEEIVIVDGGSTDRTVEIAKSYKARVTVTTNPAIFHINKQKALDMARYSWILQLDADERVTSELAKEIEKVIKMSEKEIDEYENSLPEINLFKRNQGLLEKRDGKIGKESGDYSAFFLPRLNFFLGKYLRFGGVYPDGAIRLVKKNKAWFPCKDVHEIMSIDGRVGWLKNPLIHKDSPTFKRYLLRNNRYINLMVKEFSDQKVKKNLSTSLDYFIVKPITWFFMTQIRNKGILDGIPGIIFSFFSALRFPRAYFRYITS